ncbi:domain of Kin17 curved DNA-binding protein-domain-containing protein [Linnemannia elongata]|nr:domain of Kin17 curved DNA-binding protein-domain-containing protein [Linnemannia elongata]
MAKDGFLTAKAIGNRIKAKGLQKLRWYCQICEKQCRDENGFKCHCASESHQRKILLVAESPEKYVNDYSAEFLKDFMKLLSTRYGTRRVNANLVYQEFIADRTHLHMNATKWATLSEFTMHLGKEGLAIVDETPKGWFMQWIDNSPKTLARQEAIAKKERMELDDEQREQRLIQQQIDKALALKQQQDEADGVTTELVRENEEEKIKLDISIKPVGLTGGLGGGGIKLGGGGLLKPKSLNALAAKKTNPFSSKSASTPSATTVSGNGAAASAVTSSAPTKKRSPVEEIMEREMAKKKRLEELNNSSSGRSATQQPEPEKERSRDSSRDDRDRDHRSSRDSRDIRDTRDREREHDRERDRDYRSSRDDRDDRDRDYRSSRDSRDDRDRDYRSSRDDRDRESYRSSRDSRDDRDRGREYGSSSRDSRSDRDHRDRERDRDSSYRDRGRD